MHRNIMPHKIKCFSLKELIKSLLCVFILTLIILILSLSIKKPSNSTTQTINAAIAKLINKSIDPCDNFYQFVCEKYMKNTVIPKDETEIKIISQIREKAELQLKGLVDGHFHDDDSRPLQLLKTVYQSCMDLSKIENESLSKIKRLFRRLGGWPVVDSTWNEEKFDWKKLLYNFRKTGWTFDILLSMQVDTDKKNSSKKILKVQAITQLDLDNYQILDRGMNDSDTQAYFDYMIQIVSLFEAPKPPSNSEMNEVFEFEIALNDIILPLGLTIESNYNPMSIQELQKCVSTIPWLQVINDYLDPVVALNSTDFVNVPWLDFLKDLEFLLLRTKKRTLANYMFWSVVQKSITQLPQKFRDQTFEFHKTTNNTASVAPRWKQCIEELDKMHVAASAAYVGTIFDPKHKETVSDVASYIKEAFIEGLRSNEWLDAETKERAILKIEKICLLLGFPNELLDEKIIEKYYRGLELNFDVNYLQINLNVSLFAHEKSVKVLKEEVRKPDWISGAYIYKPKAHYYKETNTVEITAAFIQEQYFDPERPEYMNFATIGEVIGHEITHSLDDVSKDYDENGDLTNWWQPESLKIFQKKVDCFIKQYENMTFPEIGMNVNGKHTLDENIADNGGYRIAYKGYLKWIEKNKLKSIFPGLSYTAKQIFWISAASNSCAKYKKESLSDIVLAAVHAPDNIPVLVPLMNSKNFAEDFECAVGSDMNPGEKCRIW